MRGLLGLLPLLWEGVKDASGLQNLASHMPMGAVWYQKQACTAC